MMTEDEARQKWCPFARVGIRGSGADPNDRDWRGASFNRAIYLDNDPDNRAIYLGNDPNNREYQSDWPKCIASECMMWRWADVPNPEWKPNVAMQSFGRDTRDDPPMYIDSTTHGRCGLAR